MRRTLVPAIVVVFVGTVLASTEVLFAQDKPPAVKDNKESVSPKDERAQLLQTVGLLSASQVYQAYLNIGFLADGMANENYEEKDAQQIMASILNLLNATDRQLEKATKLDLSKADREALVQIRKLSGLVRQQGEELQAFWKTGKKEQGDKYEKLRQEAWEGISKLLHLDKTEEK